MTKTRHDTTWKVSLPPMSRCTGRDHDLAALVETMRANHTPPVPILGAPSVGKSALALAALCHASVVARFGDRRLFVRCAGLPTRAALVVHLAHDLGLTLGADVESTLMADLARQPIALVLDGIETLWRADLDAVTELLSTVATLPTVTLTVTLRGHQAPFGVAWHDPIEVAPLPLQEAQQVFLSIAGAHYASDRHVNDLVEQQGGMPLQLVLLALAATGSSSLERLWQRWQETTPGDHMALTQLERVLTLTLNGPRMTDDARSLLSLLALLPYGIARQDLLHVLLDVSEQAVSALCETGLTFEEGSRLRVQLPVCEYIRRCHPPQPALVAYMADYYVRMIITHGANAPSSLDEKDVARLLPEMPNAEAMLLLGLQMLETSQVEQAANTLEGFCNAVGWSLTVTLERVQRLLHSTDTLEREADCTKILGDLALEKGDVFGAMSRYDEALPLYRQVSSSLGEANCLKRLGDLALRQNDDRSASHYYERAILLYQQAAHPLREANCRKSLGDVAAQQGAFDIAKSHYEAALPLYQHVESLLGEANCIRALGDLAIYHADHAQAQTHYEEALAIYVRIPEPYSIGGTHRRLARLASSPDAADHHVREARAVWDIIEREDLLDELTTEFGASIP